MKKIIPILFVIIIFLLFTQDKPNTILIPKNAIRFRIIANSNKVEDQLEKQKIRSEIEPMLLNLTNEVATINDARLKINANIPNLSKTIENYTKDYTINYGLNYFPEKEYKGVTYQSGEYESLVITLGDGLGDNWWCVLFPPLCLLEASEENLDEVTYSFYIKEIIDKF